MDICDDLIIYTMWDWDRIVSKMTSPMRFVEIKFFWHYFLRERSIFCNIERDTDLKKKLWNINWDM